MKTLLLLIAAGIAPISVPGQGQFVFNNRVPPDIDARFILSCADPASGASSSISTEYTVQLFTITEGRTLIPLDPVATTFRGEAGTATAGYVVPTTETVPGVPPGQEASIILRVLGPPIAGISEYGPWTVTLGGGTIVPPNLPLGTSPIIVYCIPEPSAAILALIGAGALLLRRVGQTRG